MPRKSSPASRTTLYRLTGIDALSDAIQQKYLDGDFSSYALDVEGREALLVAGTIETPQVSWAPALQGLTGKAIAMRNVTAAAALLISGTAALPGNSDSGDHASGAGTGTAWALTYGMGFQLLDQARVDNGFGQRIAIRTADPNELSSITRTTLDQRARIERSTIPGGENLRGFGAGDFGELVTRLVAKAEIPSLTAGGKPLRIRGSDALSVPLGKTPGELVKDLGVLDEILNKNPPLPELAILEQLVAVKDPDVIDRLESELEAALRAPGGKRLGLAWPQERIDENGTPTSFRLYGFGRRAAEPQDGLPEIATFVDILAPVAEGERAESLKKLKVMLYRDADATDSISSLIPGIRWIAFETDIDSNRYCLHDGRWYLMNHQYAERLRQQVQQIFDRDPGLTLPDWPSETDEDGYNKLAADHLGGLCLDKSLMTTELHRHGIEVCDVLTSDGAFIHVKELSSSAPASHLLAQSLVSADALLFDPDAQKQFRQKITDKGGDPDHLPNKPTKIVLGIARTGKEITAGSLFTFTQVTLVRHVQALDARGVTVVVAPIKRHT